MPQENAENACKAAGQMLEAFQSVGAKSFDLTLTNIRGEKIAFCRGLALATLLHRLRRLLPAAEKQQTNVIVRPVSRVTTLVQLDDLKDAARLKQIMAVAFLAFTTSPGNHQAWVAVRGAADDDLTPSTGSKA